MRPQHHGRPRPCPQEEARSPRPGFYGQNHWNSPSATLPPRPLIFSLQGLSNFQILTEQMTRAGGSGRLLRGPRAGPSRAPPARRGWHLLGADVGRKLAGPGPSALSLEPPAALLPDPGLCRASVSCSSGSPRRGRHPRNRPAELPEASVPGTVLAYSPGPSGERLPATHTHGPGKGTPGPVSPWVLERAADRQE